MHSSSEGQICNMLDLLRIDLIVKFMTQALKKEYIQRQKQTICIFVSLLYHFQNVVMCTMWIMKFANQYEFCAEPDPVLSETDPLEIQVHSEWSGFPLNFFTSAYVLNTYVQ